MKKIRYGNTNTFYIDGEKGGLLIDTDYAGTLPQFFKAIKAASIEMNDISYVLCTHYHPDHMGIISELQKLGVTLLIVDVQSSSVHFADEIFFRDKRLDYKPIDEALAKMICCENSRNFLCGIGICGEIIHTPSHSEDSVSIILDDGNCIVGDLEQKNRLVLSVFAREVSFVESDEDMDGVKTNSIFLDGYICKAPVYRKTPLGREIADLLLAVNRPYGKSDYIPCICWGRNARFASSFEVGAHVHILGRVQSREYIKKLSETETEKRTAYEVSVSKLECQEE